MSTKELILAELDSLNQEGLEEFYQVVMLEQGIQQTLTFEHHFIQAGFTALMKVEN